MRNTKKPLVGTCPGCSSPRMPHRVCMKCGKYDGEAVFEAAVQEDE